MGRADATVVGYDATGSSPYATDYFLGGYLECYLIDSAGTAVDGVCEDASHGGDSSLDSVEVSVTLELTVLSTSFHIRRPMNRDASWCAAAVRAPHRRGDARALPQATAGGGQI